MERLMSDGYPFIFQMIDKSESDNFLRWWTSKYSATIFIRYYSSFERRPVQSDTAMRNQI